MSVCACVCICVWCISEGNVGFGRTPSELSGPDVVIGVQQRAPVMLPQVLLYLCRWISALPVSGNQEKDKLSLRSPEHHLSVNLARAFSGVPSQLPRLRPDAAALRSWHCDDATGLLPHLLGYVQDV